MKRYKIEKDGKLEVGMVLYTKHFKLTVDRDLCKGCELCMLACPREAISLIAREGATSLLDIDENKCDYHGICAVACPFNAITISMNDQAGIPAVEHGVFPKLTRDIEVRSEKCEPGCRDCEKACPLGMICISEDENGVSVDIKKENCASCPHCWAACPKDAIEVNKFIEGDIQIKPELCPPECRNCVDVCPVNALEVGEDGKVFANDIYCIYCGACLPVCPADGALRVHRTAIRHSPVESGAWNKGLEKMTSATGLMRELSAKRNDRAREAVAKLVQPEENE
ncbi:MAG: 4Fe-4S dicluster domain-containing protein [Clostridiales bacterium]|nr:4Fe-4S dicluster domain-containing protein [Clostridiales bacterium]